MLVKLLSTHIHCHQNVPTSQMHFTKYTLYTHISPQNYMKVALSGSGFESLQDWCYHMLDEDHDCDLVGLIGLRKLTNVIFLFVLFVLCTTNC